MIDLLNLKVQNAEMQAEIEAAVLRVTRSGRYILGPEVEAFESEWAQYCGARYCVGTGNAMEAIQLILMASGIGRGSEVIVPSNTYIATWLAVTHAGATVVPVEPDESTFNIDPERIEAAITKSTAAILAVHLYGRPAEMEAINTIAGRHGIDVFADAAQAHGAKLNGRRVGGLCDATAFSFYPSKNLGALGDGGAVTTNDMHLAAKIRRMRNYGGVGRVDHTVIGLNSRLDEMQAAILRAKLPHLDRLNRERQKRASTYSKLLSESAHSVVAPEVVAGAVFHQYVIRCRDRETMQRALYDRDIDTHVHYPTPPHLEAAYEFMRCGRGSFPVAESLAREVLSLPIGYDIDVEHIARVINNLAAMKAA